MHVRQEMSVYLFKWENKLKKNEEAVFLSANNRSSYKLSQISTTITTSFIKKMNRAIEFFTDLKSPVFIGWPTLEQVSNKAGSVCFLIFLYEWQRGHYRSIYSLNGLFDRPSINRKSMVKVKFSPSHFDSLFAQFWNEKLKCIISTLFLV